jgi:pimeloyl-ACP methyl ester carboxylesterase
MRKNSKVHSSFIIVTAFFTVVATSISLAVVIGSNHQSPTAIAQQQQSQTNQTSSVLEQELLEGTTFQIENSTFSHHTASVNGIQMHYVIGGQGDPVVLLHGWPQTWYEWRHVMPALTKNYTVIAPDLRGLGDSSKPVTGYDGNTTAEDIYQLVSQLGFNKIYLVGHDIGSQTAYSYAAAHPDNVSKLVIMEFSFPGVLPREQEQKLEAPIWWFGFHQTPDIPEALTAGKEREYLSWFYKGLAYNPEAITEADIDEFVSHYSAPDGMRAGFEYYRAFPINAEQNKELSKTKLEMPVLVLGGDIYPALGGDFPGNFALNATQAVAQDVRGFIAPFSGHWIPEEQPYFVVELLTTFFSER